MTSSLHDRLIPLVGVWEPAASLLKKLEQREITPEQIVQIEAYFDQCGIS